MSPIVEEHPGGTHWRLVLLGPGLENSCHMLICAFVMLDCGYYFRTVGRVAILQASYTKHLI